MFAWIGKKGFMRGPVWFIVFIGALCGLLGGIAIIASELSGDTNKGIPLETIIFTIISILYIVAYILLPRLGKNRK